MSQHEWVHAKTGHRLRLREEAGGELCGLTMETWADEYEGDPAGWEAVPDGCALAVETMRLATEVERLHAIVAWQKEALRQVDDCAFDDNYDSPALKEARKLLADPSAQAAEEWLRERERAAVEEALFEASEALSDMANDFEADPGAPEAANDFSRGIRAAEEEVTARLHTVRLKEEVPHAE